MVRLLCHTHAVKERNDSSTGAAAPYPNMVSMVQEMTLFDPGHPFESLWNNIQAQRSDDVPAYNMLKGAYRYVLDRVVQWPVRFRSKFAPDEVCVMSRGDINLEHLVHAISTTKFYFKDNEMTCAAPRLDPDMPLEWFFDLIERFILVRSMRGRTLGPNESLHDRVASCHKEYLTWSTDKLRTAGVPECMVDVSKMFMYNYVVSQKTRGLSNVERRQGMDCQLIQLIVPSVRLVQGTGWRYRKKFQWGFHTELGLLRHLFRVIYDDSQAWSKLIQYQIDQHKKSATRYSSSNNIRAYLAWMVFRWNAM